MGGHVDLGALTREAATAVSLLREIEREREDENGLESHSGALIEIETDAGLRGSHPQLGLGHDLHR